MVYGATYPRDTLMHRAVYADVWCVCVCASHAGPVSKRLKPIVQLIRPPGSTTVLVLPYHRLLGYIDGILCHGTLNRGRGMRKLSFDNIVTPRRH